MRKLTALDIVPFAKILAKTDLKPLLTEIISGQRNPENKGELVIELVFKLLENSDKVMEALFEFIAHLEGKTVEEIKALDLEPFIDLLKELFGDKNFGSFFKLAAK